MIDDNDINNDNNGNDSFRFHNMCIAGWITVMIITGLCLILLPKNHPLDHPIVPATLLEVYKCNKTSHGLFQLNPFGQPSQLINITYQGCLCDELCNPWTSPQCCGGFINQTDYFLVEVNRDNFKDIGTIQFANHTSEGIYMSTGAGEQHFFGWLLICISVAMFLATTCDILSHRRHYTKLNPISDSV